MNYFFDAIRNHYIDFKGRSTRRQFWMFVLFYVVFAMGALLVERSLGLGYGAGPGPLYSIFTLGVFLPSVGIAVRRLHDTGKSGWFVLLFLIPIIGNLVVLILCALRGEEGDNQWGPDPNDPYVGHVDDIL